MKELKEGAVARVDLSGLESGDLEVLSQILRLAGQAESSTDMGIDTLGSDNVESIPTSALPQEPMQSAMTGIGDIMASDEYSDDFAPDMQEPHYDELDDIISLSGLGGEEQAPLGTSDEFAFNEEKSPEERAEKVIENRMLPEEILGEAPEEFGPFMTEYDAVQDGSAKTNGVENEHFVVVPKGSQFFWKRTLGEDVDFRPDPESVNTDGIVNSTHRIKDKIPGKGDNRLYKPNTFNEEAEEDDEAEEIFESINKRFKDFMGE